VLAVGGSLIVVLPGPPWELRQMWEAAATGLPALAALWERAGGGRERVVRLHGIGESQLVEVLDDPAAPSRQLIRLGICARDGELELTMRGRDQPVDALIDHLRASLGERLFSDDGRTVDALVAGALRARGETLAVAESCTGGGLGARITAQPGASDILRGGVIAYANEVKRALLGVPEEVLATDGAVSARCACAMASGAREALGCTWALATTGIAGPGGGSDEKPVGLVYVGLAGPHGVRVERHRLRGDREEVRRRTVACALHLLRR
ncbi:MAG TPA: nicotinamide-nucleotide amidohydrolase family protein, partial [Miltoncostaeaceae bacterium]|nr:nicotinamide-nucleotide amidohydrolase family protein [Miltoncostaeaceae bacterium]